MSRRFKISLLLLVFILAASLAFPAGVLADDGAPPEPTQEPAATEVVTEEPAATEAPTEAPAEAPTEASTQEPVVTQEVIATPVPQATEAPVVDVPATEVTTEPEAQTSAGEVAPEATEQTVPEILSSLPENTSVAVLDAQGELQPLTTPESANILLTGDPMWCPTGVMPGGVGCTSSFSSFTALISYLDTNNISGAGTIYVAFDYNARLAGESNSTIVFDPAQLSLSDLTIQGGWSFATNTVIGTTTLSTVGLQVGTDSATWGGNVTLRDLLLINSPGRAVSVNTSGNVNLSNVTVSGANRSGSGSAAGVFVNASGNITANNVNVSNSVAPSGFYGSGAAFIAGGNVSVTNSSFQNNSGYGLRIWPGGNATVTNVTSSDNGRNGLEISNTGSPTAQVTISNSTFNNNGKNFTIGFGKGIYVVDRVVTLSNVTATGNHEEGASFSNSAAVTVNQGAFNTNGISGLAFSGNNMNVTLNQVTANNNGINGATLVVDNFSLNDSVFSGNGTSVSSPSSSSPNGAGLFIESSQGGSMSGITTQNNVGAGMYLNSSDQSVSGGSMPSDGGGFAVSCSLVGGNQYYGIVSDTNDGVHSAPADGVLQLQGVGFVNNAFGETLILSGNVTSTGVPCGPAAGMGGGGGSGSGGGYGGGNKNAPTVSDYSMSGVGGGLADEDLRKLDCQNGPTTITLADGSFATFGCPTGDQGHLNPLVQDNLPGAMPADLGFVDALGVEILLGETVLPPMGLSGWVEVGFPVPAGSEGKTFVIYFWDPAQNNGAGGWVELPAQAKTSEGGEQTFALRKPADSLSILVGVHVEGGIVKVKTNFPGVFLLVTK